MSDETSTTEATDDIAVEPSGPTVYTFPASKLPTAIAAIEKANRKLARHGIEGEFAFTVSEPYEVAVTTEVYDPNLADDPNNPDHLGGYITAPTGLSKLMVDFTLDTPVLCFSGWEFVATLVHEEAGVIARTVPGKSLDGYVARHDNTCDHCHKARYRRDTYLVRHVGTDDEPATGEVKQIGSNCLEAFLGVRPTGLWMLGFDPIPEDIDEERDERGPSGRGDLRVPVREILRYGLAACDFGASFTPRSAVEFGGQATVDVVGTLMFSRLSRKQQEELADVIGRIAQVTDEQIDAVLDAGRAIEGDSDYANNMRVALAGENVDTRTMGLVVSAIGTWNRARQYEVERKTRQQITKGFLGEAKNKLANIPIVVTNTYITEGDWGHRTLITMLATDSGHQIKWWATGRWEIEQGSKGVIARATVKGHDTWKDIDSTVVTRAKLDLDDDAAEQTDGKSDDNADNATDF